MYRKVSVRAHAVSVSYTHLIERDGKKGNAYLHHPVEIRISFFPVPLNHAEVMKDIAHNAGLLLSDMDSFAELRGRKRLRQIVWDQDVYKRQPPAPGR